MRRTSASLASSCFLKMLTWLLAERVGGWAAETGTISDWQNGFRRGYHTNNNAFILRTAIEKSREDGATLYVAFLDLANAFPSINMHILWAQLHKLGVGGPLFDWIRWAYAKITYVVTLQDDISAAFHSALNIMTGDSASPTLRNMFFSDFILPPRG